MRSWLDAQGVSPMRLAAQQCGKACLTGKTLPAGEASLTALRSGKPLFKGSQLFLSQRRHSGQFLTRQKLQRRAATGRDMCDAIGHAGFSHCRD